MGQLRQGTRYNMHVSWPIPVDNLCTVVVWKKPQTVYRYLIYKTKLLMMTGRSGDTFFIMRTCQFHCIWTNTVWAGGIRQTDNATSPRSLRVENINGIGWSRLNWIESYDKYFPNYLWTYFSNNLRKYVANYVKTIIHIIFESIFHIIFHIFPVKSIGPMSLKTMKNIYVFIFVETDKLSKFKLLTDLRFCSEIKQTKNPVLWLVANKLVV